MLVLTGCSPYGMPVDIFALSHSPAFLPYANVMLLKTQSRLSILTGFRVYFLGLFFRLPSIVAGESVMPTASTVSRARLSLFFPFCRSKGQSFLTLANQRHAVASRAFDDLALHLCTYYGARLLQRHQLALCHQARGTFNLLT